MPGLGPVLLKFIHMKLILVFILIGAAVGMVVGLIQQNKKKVPNQPKCKNPDKKELEEIRKTVPNIRVEKPKPILEVKTFKLIQDKAIDWDEAEKRVNRELKEIQNINKVASRKRSYIIKLRDNGRSLEKAGLLKEAISEYDKSVKYATANDIGINQFAFDVDRLVILYRKTKQKEKEIELLEFILAGYSDWNNPTVDKWNERLAKLI